MSGRNYLDKVKEKVHKKNNIVYNVCRLNRGGK